MASPFLQGFQVGSSTASDALNRNLRMQELKSQQQLRMLQEQQVAQQLAIQMEARNLAIQERADMAKAITAAQQATQPFIQVPMEGQEGLDGMNPPIMEVPNPQAMTPFEAATRFVAPVIGRYRGAEAYGKFINEAGLNEIRMRNEQNEATRLLRGPEPTADAKNLTTLTNLRGLIEAEADPTRKAKLEQALADFQSLAMPTGSSFETTLPDGTVTRMTTGRQPASNPGGLTTGTATDLQKKTVAVDNSIATAVNALDTIRRNPQAIGPVGIGREVLEKGRGMIGMQGDAPVSKTRHQLALDFTQLAEGLRVDTGNMSLYERKQLEKVGDVTKAFETAQTAQDAMENIVKTLVGQKLRLLKAQNKLPDDETIALISFEEIPKLRLAGLLTDAEAFRWRDLKRR